MVGRYGKAACVETRRLPTHRRDAGVSRSPCSASRDLSSGTAVAATRLFIIRGPYGGPPTVDGGSTRRHMMKFIKPIPAFFVPLGPPSLYPRIMPALLKLDWNFRTVRNLKMKALAPKPSHTAGSINLPRGSLSHLVDGWFRDLPQFEDPTWGEVV